ncbi:MAG TPA: hypothetical protein VJW76_00825 [Verrucomicrobiae bacterium]|nr:hypothetical protein [Verrucomicrobiae bacterium]
MRFLSVADRELRAAARQRATYRIRWVTAAAFLGLLLWMLWVFGGFRSNVAGPRIFQALSTVTFLYCLVIGAIRTADGISWEKREGTLGLLFLTNLNSAEILAGKLCSSALSAVYGLFAVFPLLALTLMMGGVAFGHFWRTVLALLNAILFSVAAGFAASVVSRRQFPAIAGAISLALLFGLGLLGAAEAIRLARGPALWVEGIAVFSPLYTFSAAEESRRMFGQNRYWLSLAAVGALSWTWLALTVWWLSRTWRDRPARARSLNGFNFWKPWGTRRSTRRTALRRRFLKINPFFWLASRQWISSPAFLLVTVVLVVITVHVTAPLFGRVMGGGIIRPLLGHLFAWFWTGLAIHAFTLYYAAAAASRQLAEDKQSGALELILSTPATERTVSRGLWLAYARKMFVPALVASLVHFYFIWQGATLFVLEPPEELPRGITPGQLLWNALFGLPINGFIIDWHFGFILRVFLLVLVVLIANWFALGWVGRWLGLRMKHPGFAPMTAVVLVLLPPVLLFSLVCYVCDEMRLDRMPERQFLPLMAWIGFGIVMIHCFLLSFWAARRLRRDFRVTVTSRFQPPSVRRWWRPGWQTFRRLAAGAAVLALLLTLIVAAFYGYQNWRGRRAWVAFQKELNQRGESLDLSALLPGPVPNDRNFARSPAFQNLPPADNSSAITLFNALDRLDPESGFYVNNVPASWIQQKFTDFDRHLEWIQSRAGPVPSADRRQAASVVLDGLQPLAETLGTSAKAALLPFFQSSTNRDAAAALQGNRRALSTLERLQFVFQLRASARLLLGDIDSAGEDVLTSLRLAHLARQSPDIKASIRVQVMVARSLQPLWEGLAEHRWSEPQLAAIQKELAGFNLLSDHTNAIQRVVRAHIEVWRRIPDARSRETATLPSGGWAARTPALHLQPQAWWFDSCIQLYSAGQTAIGQVDVGEVRVRPNWNSDLSGLPLDGDSIQLFQQGYWWAADPTSVAFAQTAVNQAIIACALERFYLANRVYPESLDVPMREYLDTIPRDAMTGRSIAYQRTEEGRYILRGVGPNATDDRKITAGSDDWLWTYPAPTNAPAASAIGQ